MKNIRPQAPLTTEAPVGTMKEGGEDRRVRAEKKPLKAPTGPTASSLNDFILRLHTFARDWEDVAYSLESAEGTLLAGFLNELAEVLKHEYDTRHG